MFHQWKTPTSIQPTNQTKKKAIFNKKLRDYGLVEERTVTATLRKLLVESFFEAWEITCSSTNCEKAAKAVGIAPVDREAVKSSHFVKEIPENELNSILLRNAQRNRFSINSKMITSDEMIAEISNYVSRSGDRSLCAVNLRAHT